MSEWSNYEEWMVEVPEAIQSDEMWQFYGYRKALFLYDVCWRDCDKLLKHPLGQAVAKQLIRSAGSISANVEEGYGRGLRAMSAFTFFGLHSALPVKAKGGTIEPKGCLL